MAKAQQSNFFMRPTKDQCKDAGVALIFILLLVMHFANKTTQILPWAIVATLLLMIRPQLFKPFAALWFGLSELLGTVMSKVILTIVFFTVVTPIALFRRMIGADAMQMKQWKKDTESVFRNRDQKLGPDDLEQMF